MDAPRGTATIAGLLFLVTEVTAVAAALLYRPLVGDPRYVVGAGTDGRILTGALLELVLVAAVIGTAVVLHPVLRRYGRATAVGYLCVRFLEGVVILVGTLSVLAVVTLRQDLAGTGVDGPLVVVGRALVAVHDWAFLLGPNVALGVNSVLLAVLVYRSGLAPRPIAVLGLVGGALICASGTAVLLGAYEQLSVWGGLAALPVFAWEVSLALYLVVRGFRTASPTVPPVAGRAALPVG